MDYMTLKEAAEKWGVTPRRVNYYCAGGRIPSAVKMAGVWLIPKTAEKPTGIRIPGYPSITIEADKKDVQMNLMNPEGNPCYFTFEIVLNDTDETIYTSKMVEPGKAITEVTLEKALAAGEYPATIKITTASLTDGSAMNGANVETTIIAQ